MSEPKVKGGDEGYACKRVKLCDYVTEANQGFGFENKAYISTDDETLFFRCGDGTIVDITTDDCPFTEEDFVYPSEVHFSLTTPEKYLKKKKPE